MDIDYKRIGRQIKIIRELRGMSQMELADMANLSYSYISSIETGRKHASLGALLRISSILGVTVDELLTGNQPNKPIENQIFINTLMKDCSEGERLFIYELVVLARNIISENGLEIIKIKK